MRICALTTFSFLLGLTACGPSEPLVVKDGMTYEQRTRDLSECRAKGGIAWIDPVIACMRAKGYTYLPG